jgi:dynein regulatory complex protein 1
MRRAAEVEQELWTRMAHVISDKGMRAWRALEKQMEKYLGLLQTRANNLADVESLSLQNTELRTLLNQYLGSRINEELEVPPTHVI